VQALGIPGRHWLAFQGKMRSQPSIDATPGSYATLRTPHWTRKRRGDLSSLLKKAVVAFFNLAKI